MQKIKKVLCLLLSALMILSMGIPAFAVDKTTANNSVNETQKTATTADTQNSSLMIEISTDKEKYKALGIAQITATVTNTSNEDIQNVSAEAVFTDLAPVGKSSDTKKEVETLKAGESISFTYKATLNKSEHNLNIFQKFFLWLVRLFNGGFTAKDNGFDNGRECTESSNTVSFGKFETINTVRVWYGDTKRVINAFSASKSELDTSENTTTVYFYVQTRELLLEKLVLKCTENNDISIPLLDDGNKLNSGDVAEKDYIYTAKIDIDCQTEKTYHFYASNSRIKTNSISIDIIAPFTDKELDDMEIVDNSLNQLKQSKDYKNLNDDEKVSEIKSVLKEFEKNGQIKKGSVHYIPESKEFIFIYSCSISGGINIYTCENKPATPLTLAGVSRLNQSADFDYTYSPTTEIDLDSITTNNFKRSFISYGFDNIDDENSMYPEYKKYIDNWNKYGLLTELSVNTTVEKYKTAFLNKDFIGIGEHGECITIYKLPFGYETDGLLYLATEKKYTFCVNECPTRETEKNYHADLKKHRIYKRDNTYYITPEFFSYYYANKLNGAIVFISSCMGFGEKQVYDYNFSHVFSEYCGVDAVIGFHNSVTLGYAFVLMNSLVYDLLDGKSVKQSEDKSLNEIGYNDIEFLEKMYSDDKMSNTYSQVYRGMTLKEEIEYRKKNHLEGSPIYTGNKTWSYQTYKLNGKTQDSRTSFFITDVSIDVIIPNSGSTEIIAHTTTDENGEFNLKLPNGTYSLVFSHDNYETYGYQVVVSGEDIVLSEPIMLSPIVSLSTVSGTVKNNNSNEPIENVSIDVIIPDSGSTEIVAHTTTNENGEFNLELPNGTYSLIFTYDNYEHYGYQVVINGANIILSEPIYLRPIYTRSENATNIQTASGKCGDNLRWVLYVNGDLVISGKGEMYNFDPDNDTWWISKIPWENYFSQITHVIINDGVTSIGNYAFAGFSSNIEEISIASTVTTIGSGAFQNIKAKRIYIPHSVQHLMSTSFSLNCKNIEELCVSPLNNRFTSQNGVLYSKDMTKLFVYPRGKKDTIFIVPNNTKEIANSSFEEAKYLKTVCIPDSVNNIGKYAFFNCESLEKVTIYNSTCTIYDSKDTIIDTATIYGYGGSTAEAYAKKYNRQFVAID